MVDAVVALKGPLRVEVFAENAIGRKFYDRYGFTPVDQFTHDPSGQITIKMEMPGMSGE
jgi:putative acetyltransferase